MDKEILETAIGELKDIALFHVKHANLLGELAHHLETMGSSNPEFHIAAIKQAAEHLIRQNQSIFENVNNAESQLLNVLKDL